MKQNKNEIVQLKILENLIFNNNISKNDIFYGAKTINKTQEPYDAVVKFKDESLKYVQITTAYILIQK